VVVGRRRAGPGPRPRRPNRDQPGGAESGL